MKKVEAVEGQLDIYDILYPNSKPKKELERVNEGGLSADEKQNDE